jgi:hypothetical protein
MTTATLERPVAKSSKAKTAADGQVVARAAKTTIKMETKANTAAIKGKAAEKKAVAPVKAKAAPKAKPEPKVRRVSAMWIIRTTLAAHLDADVEMISKACTAAGVPKSNATIGTIMSDFKQTYAALQQAGRIAKA